VGHGGKRPGAGTNRGPNGLTLKLADRYEAFRVKLLKKIPEEKALAILEDLIDDADPSNALAALKLWFDYGVAPSRIGVSLGVNGNGKDDTPVSLHVHLHGMHVG